MQVFFLDPWGMRGGECGGRPESLSKIENLFVAGPRHTYTHSDFDFLIESNVAGAAHSAGELLFHVSRTKAKSKRVRQGEDALISAGIDANRTGEPTARSGTQGCPQKRSPNRLPLRKWFTGRNCNFVKGESLARHSRGFTESGSFLFPAPERESGIPHPSLGLRPSPSRHPARKPESATADPPRPPMRRAARP